MPKRDIYRLSESERPSALFRKRRKHPLTSPWLWLILILAAVTTLDFIGMIDVPRLVISLFG